MGATCDAVKEDCDGITLLGAPHLKGRPVFCLGGDQAHVLTLTEDPTRAVDLSVRAGMGHYKPRACVWWEGDTPRTGQLEGPMIDDLGKYSIFRVKKDG